VTSLLRWSNGILVLCASAAVVMVADATMVEPNRITTTLEVLPSGSLASALGGDSIAQLSDLHLRGIGRRERRLVQVLREENPALVVMTGDYADTTEGVAALRSLLSEVRPRLGVVAVPGNNDYYRGRQEEIFSALRESGVRVLRNESTILKGAGGDFAVAGVDDPFFGRDDAPSALSGVPDGMPTILLAHSPAIMVERGEGMLFNAGDADGPWGAGWFWQDGSHLRDPQTAVAFAGSGRHTLRIQRREDGAGVGAIRLVPVPAPGGSARSVRGEIARGLQGAGKTPPGRTPGEIDVDPCAEGSVDVRGSWRRVGTDGGDCGVFDEPDEGRMSSYPEAEPKDSADVEFEAPAGIAYQVWVRLNSPTSTGRSDSVYLQFSDAVDGTGAPRYRIGSGVHPARSRGLQLVLVGHTHGGQVRLPWAGPLEHTLSGGPFVMGRYDLPGMMMYVSRGIGTSYLPVRLACAPEVVILTPPRGGTGA
jgi:predicted MPP superfamily phosphohydrolase